jgi:hypothetical protein
MRAAPALAMLVLVPLAPAQISEAQAVKEARAASKAALAALKTAVHDARDAFLEDVAAVEAKFKAGDGAMADLDGMFDSAVALQTVVQEAVYIQSFAAADGVQQALAHLADGADLNGGYPEPLQLGTSGVLDDTMAAIDKLLLKTYAALDKRLNKTEAVVEAAGDLRLRVRLRPPYGSLPIAASEGGHNGLHAGLGIDVIWAARDSTLVDAGRLSVAGSDVFADGPSGLDLIVYYMEKENFEPTTAVAVGLDERWTGQLENLPRGSYAGLIQAHSAPGTPYRSAPIGMP